MKRRIWIAFLLLALVLNSCSLGDLQALWGGTKSPAETWAVETRAQMTLAQKVGQVIVTGILGDTLTEETCLYLQDLMPGGIIFQQGNILNPAQTREFIHSVEECAAATQPVPMFLTLAHEGEYVNRFPQGVTVLPTTLAIGATGDPQAAYQAARISGSELAYSGFNMVLGPVADSLINYDNEVIADRAYGGDPQQVSQFVAQAVQGYNETGVIPVLKHFPGHGGVAEDSHEVLPVDPSTQARFQELYLPPFEKGLQAGAPVVMTNHVAFPEITGDEKPTTLSAEMLDYLRKNMKFQGVIMSDAMRMKAVTGDKLNVQRASLMALKAGVDLLLLNWPGHAGLARDELMDAIWEERLSTARLDEAVRRILILKAERNLKPYHYLNLSEPDWQADQQGADDISRHSVTVLQDAAGIIPLPTSLRKVLVVTPQSDWGLDQQLITALNERGFQAESVTYPPPWEGPVRADDLLQSIPAQAAAYDTLIFFTWQAHLASQSHGDRWQVTLGERLQAAGIPLVVIAIKSPTDVIEIPGASAYIAMFGTTPVQKQAVIDALLGSWTPVGRNPLPGLLP